MKFVLITAIFLVQMAWAQCDGWESNFDQASINIRLNFLENPAEPISQIVGRVVRKARLSPSGHFSEMDMQVEKVIWGPYKEKTVHFTSGGLAEYARFDEIQPGQRYEVVFIASDRGNLVPHCGTYIRHVN